MESFTSMDTTGDFNLTDVNDFEEGEVEDGELIDDDDDDDNDNNSKDCDERLHPQSVESDKLSIRARRFGLNSDNVKQNINPALERFHKSMGVDKDTRTEALHLLGTDNMKTLDVFAYFSGYSPASIEWISDKSCNVVWLDEELCAKALQNRSIKIKGLSVENDNLDESEESISLEDIRCALPPGIWRKGQSSSLAPQLFIRYATRFDKKGMKPQNVHFYGNGAFNRNIFLDQGDEVGKKLRLETGNPWADIARQWRNFETRAQAVAPLKDAREFLSHRDIKKPKILLEKRFRGPVILEDDAEEIKEIREPKPSLFSSRKMHADIEEMKIQERNKMKSHLIQRNRVGVGVDLRDKLGRKRKREDVLDYDEPEDEPEWKQERSKSPEKEDISLRIEIDNSKEESEDEWEEKRNSSESSDSDEVSVRPNAPDLRSKLQKKKSSCRKKDKCVKSVLRTKYIEHSPPPRTMYSPLRIEIDNDVYQGNEDS